MAAAHVGKETHAESECLRENSEDFDRDHDRPEPPGHPARKMGKIVGKSLRTDRRHLDHDKGDKGQAGRHRNIAGSGGPKGHQAQEIHDQDIEERSQDERDVLLSGRPHGRENNFIANEDNENLDQVGKPGGDGIAPDLP